MTRISENLEDWLGCFGDDEPFGPSKIPGFCDGEGPRSGLRRGAGPPEHRSQAAGHDSRSKNDTAPWSKEDTRDGKVGVAETKRKGGTQLTTTNMISAQALAKRLGLKTETLGKWRRLDKGPRGWFYASQNRVIYPLDAVEQYEAMLAATPPVFSRPPLRGVSGAV